MPLQQISLDQSIYNKKPQQQRSPVSQALTPQRPTGVGHLTAAGAGEGFMERQQRLQEEAEARKYQEKMMKMQHEQEMEKLKFTAGLAEDKQKQQTTVGNIMAQGQQQGAARQKIEDNPEPAAKEMYELLKTLPDDAQNQLLNQIFTPTHAGGTMSSAGKTITTPEKYNPIAGIFIDKGWAMFDAKGNVNLSEPEREFEKGTFKEMESGDILNEATGEIIARGDIPEGVDNKLIADAYNYGSTYMGRLTEPTLLEKITPENMSAYMDNAREESKLATMNYLLGQGVSKKEAKDIANSIPIEERGKATKETKTGREAPLDEEKAKGLADYLKDNPDADLEAYRERDGDITVDKALEINKKSEPTVTKKTKKKIVEEPTVKEEKKVKDYFSVNKYSPL